MRACCLALMLTLAPNAFAADDFKIIKLEQDVRNLERQVQTLMRQVDSLRTQLRHSGGRVAGPRNEPVEPASSDWLVASNWDAVHPGMSELEVIKTLGPPASMRVENGDRVLLYAIEIGSSGFLSGSVTLRERAVTGVERPVLK